MSTSSGGPNSFLLNIFRALFGKKKPPLPAQPPSPRDSNIEPAQIVTSRILLIVYDPVMDPATMVKLKLSQQQDWNRTEDLANAFMADILQVSSGIARYHIVQRIELNEFPTKVDGFRYTPMTYQDVLRGAASPHTPQGVNYHAILTQFNILQRVANNEIDEVWIFAFPHAGFYESIMGGPGAFWCNAPALKNTDQSLRRFIVMGFSYERGVGEMLEDFGHRTESIMAKTFDRTSDDENLWQRFVRYDKVFPGKAEVGTIHYAPNSERDYDWNNLHLVPSNCYDWNKFPNFGADIRHVNASEWGNGDIRQHHLWWLRHVPKVADRMNGISNNWWQYIIDPNRVAV